MLQGQKKGFQKYREKSFSQTFAPRNTSFVTYPLNTLGLSNLFRRAIELDPEYGLLFYTDWGVYRPHLGRANMDGSDRQELINNTTTLTKEIEWPNAMTIDHPNKHIYWMDAKLLFLGELHSQGCKLLNCWFFDANR